MYCVLLELAVNFRLLKNGGSRYVVNFAVEAL
jgi:hypothetical protein